LSGVPREGEPAFAYAGEWTGGTPNKFRYNVKLAGSPISGFPVETANDFLQFDWPLSGAGSIISWTIEASTNNGATWSTPVTGNLNFPFVSEVLTPAVKPDGTITRISTSGTVPMTLSVNIQAFNSDIWEAEIYDAAYNWKWTGFRGVSDTELTAPFEYDVDVESDPAWDPTLLAYCWHTWAAISSGSG
jgi:hypothetical protein